MRPSTATAPRICARLSQEQAVGLLHLLLEHLAGREEVFWLEPPITVEPTYRDVMQGRFRDPVLQAMVTTRRTPAVQR